MPVHNADVAALFNKMADLLEISGANAFRVRAYRGAAQTVGDLPRPVADMLAEGSDLTELPGIGKDLAGKIREIVEHGKLAQLDELQKDLPGELAELMTIPGLGPKRTKLLYDKLGIDNLDKLREAAAKGKLRDVEGLGAKTEQKILEEIGKRAGGERRRLLAEVEQIAQPLVEYLRRVKGVKQAVAAGSYRRRSETVGDLDILVACEKSSKAMERFVEYDNVAEVVSRGTTRSTVKLRSGFQVDVRVVPEESYGAAMHYFTGSKAHNIAVRKIAVKKRLKLNEYGVFKGERRIAGRTEEEVFEHLGLPYIEPELREDRGEIEAAEKGRLPKLVIRDDIRGDLHCHSDASDGKPTIPQIADAARKLGYEYIAVTDHSKRLTVARGLDEKRLAAQVREIDKLNERLDGIRILKGTEVDILEDGSLDLDDAILAELDIVVASIHSKFNLPAERQTQRILRALDNPRVNILGHPTGRMIGAREPYEFDLQRVMEARDRGCFLEINAQPERLDLSDTHAKMAKDLGLKLAISTDAHTTNTLDFMRFGVGQARRGWLEADDVINTRPWAELEKLLKRG